MGYQIQQISDHIVALDLIGDFSAEDATNHVLEMDPILERICKDGEKVHFLVRTVELGKISLEGRRSFGERNGDARVGSTAVVGVNRFLKVVAQFIMVASGKQNIRFFDAADEASALGWLNSQTNSTPQQ
ncbi:MAG: STAS/SEC14 domain-containing protein [Anaerolineae bacterium]